MIIRPENTNDIDRIREINMSAFGAEPEADLVDALRKSGIPLISLVADEDKTVIGHIMFSPVTIDNGCAAISVAGLGPMAVLPGFQRKGVGSDLILLAAATCKIEGQAKCKSE